MLKNLWNKIRYTLYLHVYDFAVQPLRRYREQSIALLNPTPEERILIIGAGTGLDLEFLRGVKSITAIDITPGMIRQLQQRAKKLNIPVEAHTMDAQQLDFPDRHFDAVVLHLIVAVVPDPKRCIREAERVLKPGGRAVIFDKFLADGTRPGIVRRLVNVFFRVAATSINRRLGDILKITNFEIIQQRSGGFGGFFKIALLRKPATL